jgi:hypothetical protein
MGSGTTPYSRTGSDASICKSYFGTAPYDGGKKIGGRKRHALFDSLGLLLAVVVTAASADDGATAPTVSTED